MDSSVMWSSEVSKWFRHQYFSTILGAMNLRILDDFFNGIEKEKKYM